MYNRIIIAGNRTRNPEITTLPDGSYVTRFSLAGNTKFKQPSGDMKTETFFIDMQVYGSREKTGMLYKAPEGLSTSRSNSRNCQ